MIKIYHLKHYVFKHKQYLLNIGATFFSQFSNAITLILLTPLLTKSLGLNSFGFYGVVLNIIAFSVILDFGLNIGLVRAFIHQLPKIKTLLNTLFLFFSSLLFILMPVYYIFYHIYYESINVPFVAISIFTAIIVVQNIFAIYFDALIQAENKIYISKLFRAIKLLSELLLVIIFLKDITVLQILTITITVNIFYLLALFIYLKNKIGFRLNFSDFNLKVLIEHFKYSTWYFISSIATVLVFNTQIIILNYYAGAEIAAKYLVVIRFFDIIRIASTNFTQVLFPKIIQFEVQHNWIHIKKMFLNMLQRIFILIIFIWICFSTVGVGLFVYWIGFKDDQLLNLYQLYLIFTCLIILDNVSVIFLSALKLNRSTTIVSIFQGLFGICLSILFLNLIGYIGLLIGFLLSFIATNLFYNPLYLLKSINKKL